METRASGFRQAVSWGRGKRLAAFSHPICLWVGFGGVRPEDAKLYAIYVSYE